MKLGKLAPRYDRRTLHLADYLVPKAMPAIPAAQDWSGKVASWPMFANDSLGDCTIAAAGHMVDTWTANATTEASIADSDIITAYSAVSGYDPVTGQNDNGAVEIDVLNYWRQSGIAGHKIDAYAALEPGNHSHIQAAVYLFGGCYIGLALPLSAQSQDVWSVPSWWFVESDARPGSWGLHAVNVVGYDEHFLTVVTWGALKKMTWGFWAHYTDEAYAALSQDFIANGVAPNAIDWASLQTDLNEVSH